MRFDELVALFEARDPARIARTYARRLVDRARQDPTLAVITPCERFTGEPPRDPDSEDFPLRFVEWIRACVDPSQDGRYTEWITRVYANGGISRAEDFARTRQTLDIYDRNKRRLPPEHRDVNRIRTLADLENVVDGLGETERQRRRHRRREIGSLEDPDGWNWVHREKAYGIVVPRSHAEECAIAAYPRSRWCTAVRDDSRTFEYYARRGPLFVVVVPGDVRAADEIRDLYQIHLASGQVMDREDRPVDLFDLVERYPALLRLVAHGLAARADPASIAAAVVANPMFAVPTLETALALVDPDDFARELSDPDRRVEALARLEDALGRSGWSRRTGEAAGRALALVLSASTFPTQVRKRFFTNLITNPRVPTGPAFRAAAEALGLDPIGLVTRLFRLFPDVVHRADVLYAARRAGLGAAELAAAVSRFPDADRAVAEDLAFMIATGERAEPRSLIPAMLDAGAPTDFVARAFGMLAEVSPGIAERLREAAEDADADPEVRRVASDALAVAAGPSRWPA